MFGFIPYFVLRTFSFYGFIIGKKVVKSGEGDLVAQEGGDVILHGGPISHSWDSEHYRQLYYEIPGDCFGPYWIVGE